LPNALKSFLVYLILKTSNLKILVCTHYKNSVLKKYLEKVDSYFGSVENSPFSYFSMKKREKINKNSPKFSKQ